ncbi:MAG: META domain-containing protein [Pseudomonadota bacterium]
MSLTRFLLPLLTLPILAACGPDETISGFLDPSETWQLAELDGAPWAAEATLSFPEAGRVTGRGPCNAFNATQSAPYPWIEIGPLAATRRACPELAAETRFFEALSAMAIAEVSGDVLLLSGEDGREMVFRAAGRAAGGSAS